MAENNRDQLNTRGGGVPLEQILNSDPQAWQQSFAARNLRDAEKNAEIAARNLHVGRRMWSVLLPLAALNLVAGVGSIWSVVRWWREHPTPTRVTTRDKGGMRTVTVDCPAGFRVANIFSRYPQTPGDIPLGSELDEAMALSVCRKMGTWERRVTPAMPPGTNDQRITEMAPGEEQVRSKCRMSREPKP